MTSRVRHSERDSVILITLFSVMQMAWRERNPQARIKAAHEALEKNSELVWQIYTMIAYTVGPQLLVEA